MKSLRITILSCFTLLLSISVIAQSTSCPVIVEQTLESLGDICAETGRNEACYGNNMIDLTPQANVRIEPFDQPGDTVGLSAIDTMKLAPLNETDNTWGVAVMKLQANIPDTLPGQNVTFLLFGDVEIENAVGDAESGFTPMQAFYFKSGVGDSACTEAPESGLLIQTPEGVQEVLLNVNGANMALGSTAFLQAGATPDTVDQYELTISVLEGEGLIEANGTVEPIPAGSWVRIPTDSKFNVIGAPNPPKPYKFERHGQLPIQALERQFELHSSLTQEEVDSHIGEFRPALALRRLQELGAQTEPLMTRHTIVNTLDETVTITIGRNELLIGAGETGEIDLPRGRYSIEICASTCVSLEDRPIVRRNVTHTITPELFNKSE